MTHRYDGILPTYRCSCSSKVKVALILWARWKTLTRSTVLLQKGRVHGGITVDRSKFMANPDDIRLFLEGVGAR